MAEFDQLGHPEVAQPFREALVGPAAFGDEPVPERTVHGGEHDVVAVLLAEVFRKTVASRLDDEGYAIRHIADQLGHSWPRRRWSTTSAAKRSPQSTSPRPSIDSSSGASKWFVSGPHRLRRTRIPLFGGPPGARTRNLRIKRLGAGSNAGIRSRCF